MDPSLRPGKRCTLTRRRQGKTVRETELLRRPRIVSGHGNRPTLRQLKIRKTSREADRLAGQVEPKNSNSTHGAARTIREHVHEFGEPEHRWVKRRYQHAPSQRLTVLRCPAGRAMRHKNDWSMLVLVDMRYQSD
jgi:hypothetical protein